MAKQFKGLVVKKSGEKTVKVAVHRIVSHPIYKKRLRKTKHFLAHTTKEHQVGDSVVIEETKPIAKRKHFIVTK